MYEEQFDGELKARAEELKLDKNSRLLDINTHPMSDISQNRNSFCNYFFPISRASAINQYKDEIATLLTQILQRSCCFLKNFTAGNKPSSLHKVHENVRFICSKKGAHIYDCKKDTILEFELF